MTMFRNNASGTALWALALAVTLAVPGLAGATELTCITNCSSTTFDADDGDGGQSPDNTALGANAEATGGFGTATGWDAQAMP